MVEATKTTNILAAEKSIPRHCVTPRARLRQKMTKREASLRSAAQTMVQPSTLRSPTPVTLVAEQERGHIFEPSVEERTGAAENNNPVKPENCPCVVTPMTNLGEGFQDREEAFLHEKVNTVGGALKDGVASQRPGGGDISSGTPLTVTPPLPGSSGPYSTETDYQRTGLDKCGESSSIIAKRSAMDTFGISPTSPRFKTADQSKLWSRALAALDRMRERRLPVRHALEALLKSTVLDPEGARVSAPIFPQVSVHHELKYSGPMDPGQAMAFAAVLSAR